MAIKDYWNVFSKFVGLSNFQSKMDKADKLTNRQAIYRLCWSTYKSIENYNQLVRAKKSDEIDLSIINFCRDHISKTIDYFTSKGFVPIIDRKGETLDRESVDNLFSKSIEDLLSDDDTESTWYKEYLIKNKVLLPIIEGFWKFNSLRGISFRNMVEYASVMGDLFIYFFWDDAEKEVKMTIFRSGDVEIIPENDNIREVRKALVKYDYVDEDNVEHPYQMEITKDYVIVINDGITTKFEHNLGIIPFVHIAVNRDLDSIYGESDVLKLLPLSVFLNEKLSDISEILSYHSSPITILKGMKATNLDKSPNKIWSITKDADAFNLEMKADLTFSSEFVDRLITMVSQVSSYPKELLDGSVDKLSNTTGVAMQMLFKTLEDSLTDKKDSFTRGFELIHRIVLKLHDANKTLELSKFKNYNIGCKFLSSLPKDSLYEMQVIAQQLLAGLESKHGAMRTLGKTNPEAILKEITEETKRDAELQLETLGLGGTTAETTDSKFKAFKKNVGGISTPLEQHQLVEGRDKKADES